MLIRNSTVTTSCLLLFLLASCDSSQPTQALRVDEKSVERAIQTCNLPASASIIAYLSVGLDRYLMTPDVNGQSASITLTLTTGDIVSVEIVYVLNGNPHTVARAFAEVPAVGELVFQDSDFDLTDDNMNSVPDCLELSPDGTASSGQARFQSAGFRFSSNPPETAVSTRPVSFGSSTVAFTEKSMGNGSNALCAMDTGLDSLWFWGLPFASTVEGLPDFPVVKIDMKVLGSRSIKRSIYYFVVDHNGRSWSESLTVRPGLDWTRIMLPIRTDFAALTDMNSNLSQPSRASEPDSLRPGLYILGDYISGTGDGSCIALIQSN